MFKIRKGEEYMGIVALILSIVAIVFAFIPFLNIIGIICGIMAFIFGIINLISLQGKHKNGWGKALAAIIISLCVMWIAMFSSLVSVILFFVGIECYDDGFDTLKKYYEEEKYDFSDYYNDGYEEFFENHNHYHRHK